MNQTKNPFSRKTEKLARINREIKSPVVRLIDQDGQMRGVISINEALLLAQRVGLDLVEISPQAEPPVCKILDFGKYRYEVKKRAHESKKKQKVVTVKEMKFRPTICIGDLNVKLRKIKEFLEEGNKVKISVIFKGREIVHNALGKDLCNRILDNLGKLAKIEQDPKMEGKHIIMIISPGEITKTANN
jgi:translation initiation factor IF-3